jgi:hypothetical protein
MEALNECEICKLVRSAGSGYRRILLPRLQVVLIAMFSTGLSTKSVALALAQSDGYAIFSV